MEPDKTCSILSHDENCVHASNIKEEFESCKADVLKDLKNTKTELSELRTEVHELRTDVGGIRDSVLKMSSSLEIIAASMAKLTDFPDTWDKIKGFWAVITWLRTNIVSLVLLVSLILYAINTGIIKLP